MIDRKNIPQVVEVPADNGEHSHFRLINIETGETLWEEPEESMCDSEHIAPVVRSNLRKENYDGYR